jgi:hypothetical protein
VRHAERELDHFDAALDVAPRVGDRLAVLTRQDIGELVVVASDQLEELHEHARPALRVDGGPRRLRRGGVLDRGADFGLRCERDMRAHRSVHRLKDFAHAPRGAGDMFAADEMPVLDHVPLPSSMPHSRCYA